MAALLGCAAAAAASDAIQPGRLTLDPPTFTCLGVRWEIAGDDNRNATVQVAWRKAGTTAWTPAHPLLRSGGEHVGRSVDWLDHQVPHQFAGSVWDLEPGTTCELRLTMADPDGVQGTAEQILSATTRSEIPPVPRGRTYHVHPPGSTTSWTNHESTNLYKAYYGGIGNIGDFNMVWERPVQPGDTILVHAGIYQADLGNYVDQTGLISDGTYWLTAKGTAEQPITIKAAGDGDVVFDGSGTGVLFNLMAADHHVFEGITFRNCGTAIFAGQQRVGGCAGLTVRRCRFVDVRDGIFTLWNGATGFVIEDCVFEGRNDRDRLISWGAFPRDNKEGFHKSGTAITIQGSGHVIRHNRIAWFWNGIHLGTVFQGFERGGVAIDILNNEIHTTNDDGIEIDGGVRNIRVIGNNARDANSTISAQPIYGGPAYIMRNVLTGSRTSSLKFHEAHPSGLIVAHNTVIGASLLARGLYYNLHLHNNLYLPLPGQAQRTTIAFPDPLGPTTADGNGYGAGVVFGLTPLDPFTPIVDTSRNPWWPLKKYPDRDNQRVLPTLDALRQATGLERSGRMIDASVFLHPLPPAPEQFALLPPIDATLAPDGAAIDAGLPLPGINDRFTGGAPDLGALESGLPAPICGPR